MSGKGRTVYSTERGDNPKRQRLCPRCGADPCRCEPAASLAPAAQSVRVRRERAGRGGKTVTVAGPFVLVRAEAAALLADWKKLCGGGGTLRGVRTEAGSPAFELEVQGDHADRLTAGLMRAGYRAKRAGG